MLVLGVSFAFADDTVTIPKSRLEELERKERELESLKRELGKAKGETERAQEQLRTEQVKSNAERAKAEEEKKKLSQEAAEAKAALATSEQPVVHDSPGLATLPPLKKGEVVDAMDLMNHFRADALGAEARYGKQRVRIRGVVTGFDKPSFVSYYFVYLRTTEKAWRVRCLINPPSEFKAIYTTQHDEVLMGIMQSGARLTLMRAGQTVEIEGVVRELKEQNLIVSSGKLLLAE